jgi:hypothetical protein
MPCATSNNQSTSQRSSLSNAFINSTANNFPTHSLIEGSIEYRELKRLYMREQNQAEEWRKDYGVLKRQLVDLKATTIRKFIFSLISERVFCSSNQTLRHSSKFD